jgi:hypothetical protein
LLTTAAVLPPDRLQHQLCLLLPAAQDACQVSRGQASQQAQLGLLPYQAHSILAQLMAKQCMHQRRSHCPALLLVSSRRQQREASDRPAAAMPWCSIAASTAVSATLASLVVVLPPLTLLLLLLLLEWW